ncbi:MAG: TonB-dependent receptor [Candidatus Omnitrophica bacterium]|nr:TonB-dependent receptor [Candidatus Omnitrophota bacterium]
MGRVFKVPSLYQLYSSYGDPNLTPEKSESYQVGIEQSLFKRLKFSSTYFHIHLSNLIDFNMTTWKYYNTGKAKIEGWENKLEYSLSKEIRLKLSYANIDAEKKEDGSRLLRRPKNKAILALEVLKDRLKIYPELTYVRNRIDSGGEKLKAYLLVNLSLNFELYKDSHFFIRLENLLDRDYELVNAYQSKKNLLVHRDKIQILTL